MLLVKLSRQEECERVLLRALRIRTLHFSPHSKEMVLLRAKMAIYGMNDKLIQSDGISYEEYKEAKNRSGDESSAEL